MHQLTHLGVEHLALRAETITLLHERVDLLASLENAFDRLVQHDFSLIQLLLNLHDAVRLLWILILDDVLFELREGDIGIRRGEGTPWILGQKLIQDFGEQLMSGQGGVVLVGDDDARHAL